MAKDTWSNKFFEQRQTKRDQQGVDAFVHHRQMQSAAESERHCHPAMDLRRKPLRESRDSDKFPESLAITVFFDETGSMGKIPRVLQQNLNQLMGSLLRHGVKDPQVMIGAIGDAGMGEIAPVQVGEWETDLKIDDCLGQLFLEGKGGGNGHESYDLALYAMARHTSIDCWEKRQHKGCLVIIGDELPYAQVDRRLVKDYIGDDLDDNIALGRIVREVKERFEVLFILPTSIGGNEDNYLNEVQRRWADLFGSERCIVMHDPSKVSEIIANWVGTIERAKRGDVANATTEDNAEPQAGGRKRRSRVTTL